MIGPGMESIKTSGRRGLSISRSDIRIDAEGRWFYRDAEMIRRDIVRLFYQNLIREET
jgi:hypothetical protein